MLKILKKNYDAPLLFCIIGLSVFGLIMMSSMSVVSSYDYSGENAYYFIRHAAYLGVGSFAFITALLFPIKKLRFLSVFGFTLALILMILTFFVGENYGTIAKLWLNIGGISIQPVEILKIATIVFLSALFASERINMQEIKSGFSVLAIILGILILILYLQSDFGSLLIIIVSAGVIYFVAGAPKRHVLGGSFFIGLSAFIVILNNKYVLERITTFLDPTANKLGSGFQVDQALIAIGSGGFNGRGFHESIQKFDYLPEVQSDTIFAAIAEEMGFWKIVIMISFFLFIGIRGLKIAQNCRDKFEKLMACGISVLFLSQAFINIAVNMSLFPTTGITLPLISYGGTSLIITLFSLGLLLQISVKNKNTNTSYQKYK